MLNCAPVTPFYAQASAPFSASPEAAQRQYAQDSEPAYTPDIASEIDKEEEILADTLGVTINQALAIIKYRDDAITTNRSLVLARAIALLLDAQNIRAMVYAIAFASGLDQINGKKSQSEVAKEIGCTRALLSHYTVGAHDIFSGKEIVLECTKFRKSNDSRETFRKKATNPLTAAKRAVIQRKLENANH